MNLELVAKSASQLFSLPEICIRLSDLIYDPDSSIQDIAELIAVDPSLSARLLKIANSSFYSFPSQIDTLSRAITLIGTADLYSLALATSTPEMFKALDGNEHINLEQYWRHSVITGLIGRSLAKQINDRHSENLFLAGLFHNLGKLVILEQMPDKFIEIQRRLSSEIAPWVIEKEILDYSYADVGQALLEVWNMPNNIIDMVANQHNPELAIDKKSASLIHIANRQANELELRPQIGFDFQQAILPTALQSTGISFENIDAASEESLENCQSMIAVISGKRIAA
ncbi:MAG: HDOD domain-containing protein [Gammaproteobacteria bacterium]|nr:HDOD domain-containing protein [Gammaproteobacteria bacterium]NNJ71814.1 HDOD domain-containing protein [Enterobacterales bacterium]